MGDTVRVKQGFGRNFLIPTGKALRATKENKEFFEETKAKLLEENKEAIEKAEKLRTEVESLKLAVVRSASDTGILYVPSHTRPYAMSLVEPDDPDSDWPYVINVQRNIGPMGLPLTKPPYRRITAIDLNTGEHVWQTAFGKGPANHPLLEHLNLPDLGLSLIHI